ncbi:MAG: N-acetyl-gamma-glutamyl-phosphate reductase [Acidobacteriota bacterium]|nr:MAG: N-acetyl-gamma-glutamyl-phosphate reductase [Acidobacteriota bacterium]
MKKIQASIVGGSGYTGGETLRLLLYHPEVEVKQITSERKAGKPVTKAHPNLRKKTSLAFSFLSDLEDCDVLFLCMPHGETMKRIDAFRDKAKRLIDLSADFRLNDAEVYAKWYKHEHEKPALMREFVYGIPELHREEMKDARYVSSAGCNATVAILGLYPLYKAGLADPDRTVVEVKAGSSEGGNEVSESSHHPERSGCVRSFSPTGHRHVAEVLQELPSVRNVHFSATALDMVRGALATCHVFPRKKINEKAVWKIYREAYGGEPFIRIVKDSEGSYRYPEPKLLTGTNMCDIGFKLDPDSNRLVVISAIDNLMKGAGGQAIQAFNIMHGFPETTGLEFPGLHPI